MHTIVDCILVNIGDGKEATPYERNKVSYDSKILLSSENDCYKNV